MCGKRYCKNSNESKFGDIQGFGQYSYNILTPNKHALLKISKINKTFRSSYLILYQRIWNPGGALPMYWRKFRENQRNFLRSTGKGFWYVRDTVRTVDKSSKYGKYKHKNSCSTFIWQKLGLSTYCFIIISVLHMKYWTAYCPFLCVLVVWPWLLFGMLHPSGCEPSTLESDPSYLQQAQ